LQAVFLQYTLPILQPQPPSQGIKKLRTARTLEAGMVLTVEPGCYFMEPLLTPALSDPKTKDFFDVSVLQRFRGFGGVRLEDVVAVTDAGVVNFTLCPRTVAEVESVMAGGPWPPARDDAPVAASSVPCVACFVLFCFVLFCFVLFCFVLFCFVCLLVLVLACIGSRSLRSG
jgi:hypothetical protein